MTPEQLKASILQRAMEGKLVPQDPNDEPASELLKRIKAEKEKLIKEGKIKRDKNETEIFRGDDGLHYEKFADGTVKEIDVPFDIPESWEWTRARNVLDVRDGTHDTPKYVSEGVPLLTSKNLVNGQLLKEPSKLISIEDSNAINQRSKVDNGDILMAMIGSIGNPVLVSGIDYQFSVKNVAIFKPVDSSDVNMKFIYEYLSFHSIELKNTASGAVQSFVSLKRLRDMMIPIPPNNEQIRILGRLSDAQQSLSSYSDSYQLLEELNKKFPEKLRKSILQYAMQGKLVPQDPNDEPVEVLLEKIRQEKQKLFEEGKLKKKDLQESIIYKGDDNLYYENIPETWKIVSLGTIGKITSGGTPRSTEPKFYDGDIKWITPADLGKQQDSICFGDSIKHISILGLNSSSAQRIEENSIVYSSRAPIGHINIVKSPYTTNQGCKSVTPYHVNVEWLYHAIKNETPNIIKEASGTTFLEISATKFSETYISLPPLEEQQRITVKVESLNQMISQFDRLS